MLTIQVNGILGVKDSQAEEMVNQIEKITTLLNHVFDTTSKHSKLELPTFMKTEQIRTVFAAKTSKSTLNDKDVDHVMKEAIKKVISDNSKNPQALFVHVDSVYVNEELYKNDEILPWMKHFSMKIVSACPGCSELTETTISQFAQAAWSTNMEDIEKYK